MSRVWSLQADRDEGPEALSQKTLELYRAADEGSDLISEDDFVGIKIHFGEGDNVGHINPGYLIDLIDHIKQAGGKPFLTDANTLYSGQRKNSIDHLMQAHDHGFTPDKLGAPVIIADGLLSKNYSKVEIPGEHFDEVNISNDVLHTDVLIGVSHVTGHMAACMGATIKNLGMGCASRSGKQLQHADVKPSVDPEKCQECGQCVRWCPVGAIEIVDGKGANIDKETCYGCAECIATCQFGAISVAWSGTSRALQEKMAEYALGVIKDKKDKSLFFNFLIYVTKDCDCLNEAQERIVDDIGILASHDPVAVDQAATDILRDDTGSDVLREIWSESDLDYNLQLKHAEKIGLGSREYQLVEL